LLARSFISLIDAKLESLQEARSNTDEAAAEIADYEDLKAGCRRFSTGHRNSLPERP
jgi:hypothetical protein